MIKSERKNQARLTCYCQGPCLLNEQYSSCSTERDGKCFSLQERSVDGNGNIFNVWSYGCLRKNETLNLTHLSTYQNSTYSVQYCANLDYCNKPATVPKNFNNSFPLSNIIISVLIESIILSLIVIFVLAIIMFYQRFKGTTEEVQVTALHRLESGNDAELTSKRLLQQDLMKRILCEDSLKDADIQLKACTMTWWEKTADSQSQGVNECDFRMLKVSKREHSLHCVQVIYSETSLDS